jgi:hypothetical protein
MIENGTFADALDARTKGLPHTSGESMAGPQQKGIPGMALRTFHPKIEGHAAMKDIIVERLKKDIGPKTPAPAPSSRVHGTLHIGMAHFWTCQRAFQNQQICTGHTNQWFFFSTFPGEELSDLCAKHNDFGFNDRRWGGEHKFDNPPWPGGEYKLHLKGSDYVYKTMARMRVRFSKQILGLRLAIVGESQRIRTPWKKSANPLRTFRSRGGWSLVPSNLV